MSTDYSKLLSKTPEEWRVDYMADLELDKHRLDDACAEQPQRLMVWAELQALATKLRAVRQERLRTEEAKLDLKVRRSPELYGMEHPVKESAVKSVIQLDPTVGRAKRRLREAHHYWQVMKAAVEAMEHRKSMIREEGELWRREYYSSVDVRDAEYREINKRIRGSKQSNTRRD